MGDVHEEFFCRNVYLCESLHRTAPFLEVFFEESQYIVKKSMDSVNYEHKDGRNILTIRKTIG